MVSEQVSLLLDGEEGDDMNVGEESEPQVDLNDVYAHLLSPGQTFEQLAMSGIDAMVVFLRDKKASSRDARVILSQLFSFASSDVLEDACCAVNQRVVEPSESLWLDNSGRLSASGLWFRRLEGGLPPCDSLDR